MTTATRIRDCLAMETTRLPVSDDAIIEYPDPLGLISVAMAIEDDFGIGDIPEDDYLKCRTVNDWVDLVERMKPSQ